MKLFLDTETTGLWHFNKPNSHPDQPHLVQLALYLTDDHHNHIESGEWIIKPEDWTISPAAEATHGITQDRAIAIGEDIRDVLRAFNRIVENSLFAPEASYAIAHNIRFDTNVLLRALSDNNMPLTTFSTLRPFCTMFSLTKRMNLRRTSTNSPKWPTLDEAYRHCFQKPIPGRSEGLHGAMIDTLACRDIYLHGISKGWWR